jgi:hypothetical protein
MKENAKPFRMTLGWFYAFLFLGVVFLLVTQGIAKQSQKSMAHKEAFKMYEKKCLGCHDSVADPEKPGRTRDDWHLVIHVMHDYGMDMTADEADVIVDLLYDLRKGMEREAG